MSGDDMRPRWRRLAPAGPWDDEPAEFAQWIDRGTGLVCFARRALDAGTWCGYVCLPPSHRAYGWSKSSLRDLHVHGGITWANPAGYHGIGPEVKVPPGDLWVLGFDTMHPWDLAPSEAGEPWATLRHYRSLAFIVDQCANLARRLGPTRRP